MTDRSNSKGRSRKETVSVSLRSVAGSLRMVTGEVMADITAAVTYADVIRLAREVGDPVWMFACNRIRNPVIGWCVDQAQSVPLQEESDGQ